MRAPIVIVAILLGLGACTAPTAPNDARDFDAPRERIFDVLAAKALAQGSLTLVSAHGARRIYEGTAGGRRMRLTLVRPERLASRAEGADGAVGEIRIALDSLSGGRTRARLELAGSYLGMPTVDSRTGTDSVVEHQQRVLLDELAQTIAAASL